MFSYQTAYQQQADLIGRLQVEVARFMSLGDVQASARGDSIVFVGRLLNGAEETYSALRDRLRPYGYTPILRKDGEADVVVAQRGLVRVFKGSSPLIHLALFGATLLTTLFAGATFAQANALGALRALLNTGSVVPLVVALAAGVPFAATLLLILGVHEMGHYVAARIHGVQVTLPYFIPVPFGLGTFGAFIAMKSPVENRKSLFDVGLAGPIAGFVIALPLMVVGLLSSKVVPATGGQHLGLSLLVNWLVNLVQPHAAGYAVQLHPIAIAAWFGLLITGLNLMPMGQLDGGHVAYAVLGNAARPIAFATFFGLLAMGYFFWSGWYTWAIFALITGLGHPEPANDITPLDGGRRFIGLLTLGLFLLLITPKPF
ncbi:MAG: site-2 protease family protein [Chloroflexi bacterium]|nr:site-2 protease family protein [Chloroflexota bacterium]